VQMNPVVGDLSKNAERILEAAAEADRQGADLAVFPELALTGYPPEDLLLRPGFVADNLEAISEVAKASRRCALAVGFVDLDLDLRNAAAICCDGEVKGIYHKRLLPNYGVFDEGRYFRPSSSPLSLYHVAGVKMAVSICEDAWSPDGPLMASARGGADLVVNLNASPYYRGRLEERARMLATRAADASCAIVYLNCVGGQDELVFDGGSMVFDAEGELVARLPQFAEELAVFDLEVRPAYRKRLLDPRGRTETVPLPVVEVSDPQASEGTRRGAGRGAPWASKLEPEEECYQALVLGTRDYVQKNDFSEVVVGLSGGIDSSLVTLIATDALGPERVHAVAMPSRYSSPGSLSDARCLADNLGVELMCVPIEEAHRAFEATFDSSLGQSLKGLAEENLQSRIRGVILMALSNSRGWLVLTTGNKSEVAVGYSTLYGDTAGGFGVIKDIPKTLVYQLARWRNQRDPQPVLPPEVLVKAPSAELRPGQRDDQSLPPYELLDPVLAAYIEQDMTVAELVAAGFDEGLVTKVAALVDRAEYKRRQSPPGIRVTPKAFGRDRRMPITNRYR